MSTSNPNSELMLAHSYLNKFANVSHTPKSSQARAIVVGWRMMPQSSNISSTITCPYICTNVWAGWRRQNSQWIVGQLCVIAERHWRLNELQRRRHQQQFSRRLLAEVLQWKLTTKPATIIKLVKTNTNRKQKWKIQWNKNRKLKVHLPTTKRPTTL